MYLIFYKTGIRIADRTHRETGNEEVKMNNNDSGRMGTEAIPSLVWKLSLPMIAATVINNLYNIVDSIFISYIDEKALTALTLAAPVQLLMAALGSGNAVGLNAVISRALGAEDKKLVKSASSAAIFIALCSYMLILLAQFLVIEPFFLWQTNDPEIAAYGISYLRVCMIFSFGCMTQWVFDRFLIATGKVHLFTVSLVSASVTNLILDPIFIFGWLGMPALGTAGAGYATVIGQCVGAVVSILLNVCKNREIQIGNLSKVQWKVVAQILQVGIPSGLIQGITSFVGMAVNLFIMDISATAVAAYGICLRVQNMILTVPNGISMALIPIIAYNYGAGRPDREKSAFRWGMIYSMGIMFVMILILEIFPEPVLQLFNASDELLQMGAQALRILAVSIYISVYSLILSAVLQSLGKGITSMLITLSRQAIFLLPFLFLFSRMGNLTFIWSAFIVAEVLGLMLGLVLHKKYVLFSRDNMVQ